MKNLFRIQLALTLIMFFSVSHAQTESPEHNAIRQMRDHMLSCIEKNDIECLLTNVTGDAVFTAMNGETVRGHDGIRTYFNKMMKGPDSIVKSLKPSLQVDQLATLYDENTGLATGSSDDSYELRDGSIFKIQTRWTAVLRKDEGNWKLASFQATTSPFNNPILNEVKKKSIIYGVIASVIFLLIGFAAGFALKK